MKSFSLVRLVATPGTAAHQAPPSMGFSRQESWSGVPLPSPIMSIYEDKCSFSLPLTKTRQKKRRETLKKIWIAKSFPGFPGGLDDKESVYSAGDPGPIPGLGRSPGEGNLEYSCLENPMDRSLAGYSPWCHRAGLHWVTNTFTSLTVLHKSYELWPLNPQFKKRENKEKKGFYREQE